MSGAHFRITLLSSLLTDRQDGQFATEEIRGQCRAALENLKEVLEVAGSSLENVVKVTILLTDLATYGAVNEVYAEFFEPAKAPARACYGKGGVIWVCVDGVEVPRLPLGGLVEVHCEAWCE